MTRQAFTTISALVSQPKRLISLALVGVSLVLAPAGAEEGKAYKPIAAQTGKAIEAPAGLLDTARALRAAAAAKDVDAVFALLADDVTFVRAGLSLYVPRRVEKKSFATAQEALEEIGLAYTEGEVEPPKGTAYDPKKARIGTAMATLVGMIDGARWGRDPLVVGGFCTSPGAKWDPAVAKKAGIGDKRGSFVTADTRVRASASAQAKELATLKPGQIFVSAGGEGDDGWAPVTLPSGKTAWAPPKSLHGTEQWGICFLPDGQGGWLWSAVVAALL